MLWGSTKCEGGTGGWEIWESKHGSQRWSTPQPAAFNSPQNNFDPSFSPDGKGVYFFSNRPGGLGGDDIWFAPYDPATGEYEPARNSARKSTRLVQRGPVRFILTRSGRDEWRTAHAHFSNDPVAAKK